MEPDKAFRLLIVNFAIQKSQFLNGQVAASAPINPTCLVRSTLIAQEILGTVGEPQTTVTENSEPLRFPNASPSATPEEETKDSLNTLMHDRLSSERKTGGTPDDGQKLVHV